MKKYIVLAGTVTIILIACLVYIVVQEDRIAPVIIQENKNMVYKEGEDSSLLLSGIRAEDDMDGDVTNSVIVGDLIVMPDGMAAKITYYAKDSSNNVGQLEMTVPYEKE